MLRPNIENFIGCDCDYERSRMVLYGAPFDSTTSFRPGARFGPSAMRHESFGLETYSPYQDADLTERAVLSRPVPLRSCKMENSPCCWAASIWSHWERCALR